jgi:hypothetical protein
VIAKSPDKKTSEGRFLAAGTDAGGTHAEEQDR